MIKTLELHKSKPGCWRACASSLKHQSKKPRPTRRQESKLIQNPSCHLTRLGLAFPGLSLRFGPFKINIMIGGINLGIHGICIRKASPAWQQHRVSGMRSFCHQVLRANRISSKKKNHRINTLHARGLLSIQISVHHFMHLAMHKDRCWKTRATSLAAVCSK